MVSLKQFLEQSSLQEQLQQKLLEEMKHQQSAQAILGQEAKDIITSCLQAALENYIGQVYVLGMRFEGPEELREAMEKVSFYLSPETQSKIVANCTEEEAYTLGRTYYGLSKKQLPC